MTRSGNLDVGLLRHGVAMSIDALEASINEDLNKHLRATVLKSLLKNGSTKLPDLVKLTEHTKFGEAASSISIQEIIDTYVEANNLVEGGAEPVAPAPAKGKAKKKAAKKKTSKKKSSRKTGGGNRKGGGGGSAEPGRQVNFRDPDEKQRYANGIEAIVKERAGEPVSSTELVDACGGSSNQAREILKGLVENNKVVYVGQARATRYYWRENATAEIIVEFNKQRAEEQAGAVA